MSERGILALFSLLWVVGAGPAQAQSLPANAKTVRDTVSLAQDGTVTVDNHTGSVSVTTWDRDRVGYEVAIIPAEEDADVPLTTLDVSHTRDRLELAPDFPWSLRIPGLITISPGGKSRPKLDYTLAIPASADLVIDVFDATVEVSGVEGSVQIDTYSGPVRGTGLHGDVALDTYSGEAHLTFSRLAGPLTISSYSGAVTLTLPRGSGFDLKADLRNSDQLTVSGPLSLPPAPEDGERIVNGGGPRLLIEAHSGPIELRTR